MKEYSDIVAVPKKRGPKPKMDSGMQDVFFLRISLITLQALIAFILRQPEEDLKFYTSFLERQFTVKLSESAMSHFLASRDITLKFILPSLFSLRIDYI